MKLGNTEIVPAVIGALRIISAEFDRWVGKLGKACNVEVIKKNVLLGAARILRKVSKM